jgi:hypothetical protein
MAEIEVGRKEEEEMGEVVGIETSLRRPCEPAPVLVEGSRLLSSTGGFFDVGCCALGEGSLTVEAWGAPVVEDAAIGRAFWGCEMQVYGEFLAPPYCRKWNQSIFCVQHRCP